MKKRILACIFAAATLASLASCGNGGGSSSSTSTASGESGGESTAAEVTTVDYHYVNFGTIAETEPVDDVINEHLESVRLRRPPSACICTTPLPTTPRWT